MEKRSYPKSTRLWSSVNELKYQRFSRDDAIPRKVNFKSQNVAASILKLVTDIQV